MKGNVRVPSNMEYSMRTSTSGSSGSQLSRDSIGSRGHRRGMNSMAMAGQMVMNFGSGSFGGADDGAAGFISIPTVSKQRSDTTVIRNFDADNFERDQEAEDFFLGSPQKKKRDSNHSR